MPTPYEETTAVTTDFPPGTLWLDIEQHFHLDVDRWHLEQFMETLNPDRLNDRRNLYDLGPALDLGRRTFILCASAAFTPAESPRQAPLSWAAGKAAWAMLMPAMELLDDAPWSAAQILEVTTEVRLSGKNEVVLTMHHPLEEIRSTLYRE